MLGRGLSGVKGQLLLKTLVTGALPVAVAFLCKYGVSLGPVQEREFKKHVF